MSQQLKRKTIEENEYFKNTTTIKRIHLEEENFNENNEGHDLPTPEEEKQEDSIMIDSVPDIVRPSTPPLGMTLSHYDPSTGTYTSSQYNSYHVINNQICTGMTPVYRAPFERWGSCLI